MFKNLNKRAKKALDDVQPPKPQPVRDPELEQAERDLARLTRVKNLGAEAEMWRKFADGCEVGRWVAEDYRWHSAYLMSETKFPERLSITMDADSAPLWKNFALQMAEERQRRMRDLLSVK